jgi:hypothetical protein
MVLAQHSRYGKQRQSACKPGSVWPGLSSRRDGHSSGTPVAGRLEQPTRATGPTDRARGKTRASLLFGFAPGGACRAADVAASAVRSCRTLSPLPRRLAVAPGRFAFCGAIPGVAPAGRYPAPCPYGARTFLRPSTGSGRRPSGRLAQSAYEGEAPTVKEKGDTGGHEPAARRSLAYSARGAGTVLAMHSIVVWERLAPIRAISRLSGAA